MMTRPERLARLERHLRPLLGASPRPELFDACGATFQLSTTTGFETVTISTGSSMHLYVTTKMIRLLPILLERRAEILARQFPPVPHPFSWDVDDIAVRDPENNARLQVRAKVITPNYDNWPDAESTYNIRLSDDAVRVLVTIGYYLDDQGGD